MSQLDDDQDVEGPASRFLNRSIGPDALKALTHPLRVRMYDLLADEGPATASQLGARLGESSGTTSYHLRLLAKHGFIEEDPERGNRRERYWKVRTFDLEGAAMMDDPRTVADLRLATQQLSHSYTRQIETWLRTAPDWGSDWMSASVSSLSRFDATPEELGQLREEVLAVISKRLAEFKDREPPPGSRRVAMQFHLFPLGEPGTHESS